MLGSKLEIFKDILPSFLRQGIKNEEIGEPNIPEFIEADKGHVSHGGVQNFLINFDSVEFQNITQLIHQYNQFALLDFVEEAVDEIVDEAIVMDDFNAVVNLNLDLCTFSESSKKKIIEEFDYLKNLLKLDTKADEYFRRWYIQGRYYIQPLFGKTAKDGIVGFHHLSPYKIFRFYDEKTNKYWYYINQIEEEWQKKRFFKPDDIPKEYLVSSDHIIFIPSGLTDAKNKYYISHLHKAIKPANQLKLMEDSMVVYRFTRAPERRAFYIDVGKLGQTKADQYVKNLMNKFKTRLNYDTSTGMINQSKSIMTMLEDYWLPRMGTKGTEVQTLAGGQQLGEITDVLYFKRRVWKALKLPSSRADNDNAPSVDFGSSEFSREELKFARFCRKLRSKFAELLTQSLKIHLVRKGIVTLDEWMEELEDKIRYLWNENSYWAESKELALLERRVDMLEKIKEHRKYFSDEYVNKNILRRTDDEIELVNKQIAEDLKNNPPVESESPENFEEGQ